MVDKWEAKEAYVQAKNRKNEKVKSLTEEQHEALQELGALRHDFHSSIGSMWSGNANDLLNKFNEELPNINGVLEAAGLPKLQLIMSSDLPSADDYYCLLDDADRSEWEEKAEAFNEENPDTLFSHDGFSFWQEMSGEYTSFIECCERQNDIIEDYLAEVDKVHGTGYCPTGFARLG